VSVVRIIAIANHKGGAAKTTTAVNLSACLAARGRRVLLVDLDPQANASAWLGVDAASGTYAVLAEEHSLKSEIRSSSVRNLSVVPASQRLAAAEKILAGELGGETLLARRIAQDPLRDWDYVLIDTPPALGLLTINALAAAEEALIPVEAHVLALSGVVQIMSTLALVQERINPKLRLAGFVISRFNTRTRHCAEVRDRLIARYPDHVLSTAIRENVRLAEAPTFALPISEYAPASTGATDYAALAAEILAMEGPEAPEKGDHA
jgi:chromosome partitioning protein